MSSVADVAAGSILTSGGTSTNPSFSTSLPATVLNNITSLSNLTSAGSLATVGTLTSGATGSGFTVNFGSSTTSGAVPVANGGTGQITAQAARGSLSTNTVQGLNIEEMTIPSSNGDTAYQILATDRTVAVGTTALTLARTWTLPLGSTANAGQTVCVVDKGGGVNSTNTLTIAAHAGGDTIQPSSAATLKTQYGSACFTSDGATPAKWTSVGGGAGVPGGSDTQVQFNQNGAFQGSSNLVWNYTSGYLGVGTSSGMNTTLYVAGNTTTNVVHFAGAPGGDGSSVQGTVGGTNGQVQYDNNGTFGGASNFIYSGGNVGVGTTGLTLLDAVTEARPLTVAASDSSTTEGGSAATLTISNTSTTTSNSSALAFADLTGNNTNNYADAEIVAIHGARTSGQYNAGQLAFMVAPGGNVAPQEAMRIAAGGNVGIGTTVPQSLLHMYSSTAGSWGIIQTSAAGDDANLQLQTPSGGWIIKDHESNSQKLYIGPSAGLLSSITPVVVITQGGNVGIGTTAPGAKLDVTGNIDPTAASTVDINGGLLRIGDMGSAQTETNGIGIKFNDTGVAHASIKYLSSSNRLDFCQSSNSALLPCDGTPAVSMLMSGNVGIGTTAPRFPLDVRVAANQHIQIDTDPTGNSFAASIVSINDAGSAWTPIEFCANTYAFLDGNVGIGTTSPQNSLSVAGAIESDTSGFGLRMYNAARSQQNAYLWSDGTQVQLSAAQAIPLEFLTSNSEHMRIDPSGNVGIGTTAPKRLLQVGAASGAAYLQISGGGTNSGDGAVLEFAHGGNASGDVGYYSGIYGGVFNPDITIYGAGNPILLMSGNVGIGSTSPNATLTVLGTVYFGPGLTAGAGSTYICRDSVGNILVSGSACGTSDMRLKTDVAALSDAEGLRAIQQLHPVTFNWKDAAQNAKYGRQIGFLAQDVQPILPQLVTTNGTMNITLADGTKQTITNALSVDYPKLVVPLVKAVQQLKANDDDRDQKLAALEADNDNLRARLDSDELEIAQLKRQMNAR